MRDDDDRCPSRAARPHVCFVVPNAYGAMTGGRDGHVGGAEHQTTMMARWFAAKGYPVSLLTWDEGQPDGQVIDGVRVFKLCRLSAGVPRLRFLHPRMTSLAAAMRRADADVYYHNSCEREAGLVAIWCRRHHRKFVHSIANDAGCEPDLPRLTKRYERSLYRHGLRRADRLIAQTNRQRDMLRDGFGLDAVVLPMPCPGPSVREFVPPTPPSRPLVVWVGRAAEVKRMEWILDISERVPEAHFEIAAANIDQPYGAGLRERAERIPNVTWLGPVPRDEMPALYRRATCLCCTSIHEGFPNTFLEAWSHGRPLVTSFDPDGMVERLGLGLTCRDHDGFVVAIRALLESRATWTDYSRKARRYYEENHLVDVAMARFEEQFRFLCRDQAAVAV